MDVDNVPVRRYFAPVPVSGWQWLGRVPRVLRAFSVPAGLSKAAVHLLSERCRGSPAGARCQGGGGVGGVGGGGGAWAHAAHAGLPRPRRAGYAALAPRLSLPLSIDSAVQL